MRRKKRGPERRDREPGAVELTGHDAARLAEVIKALAHPVRLKLSIIASCGEGCACDFPAAVGKTQATVSHHLSQLVEAGILTREQRGKWAWFQINHNRIDELTTALARP